MSTVACNVVTELRDRLVERIPEEPTVLRAELYALVREEPAAARDAIATAICGELARAWDGDEEGVSIDRRALEGALAAASRETWLWVVGERTWMDTARGLAGRTARRSSGA